MRKHLLEKLVKLHHPPRPPPKVITWADTTPVGKTTAGPTSTLLRDLKFFLDRSPLPPERPGDYAEYFIEDQPEAGVVLRRKDGTMIAHIPLDVWDHARTKRFQTQAPNISEAPRWPYASAT